MTKIILTKCTVPQTGDRCISDPDPRNIKKLKLSHMDSAIRLKHWLHGKRSRACNDNNGSGQPYGGKAAIPLDIGGSSNPVSDPGDEFPAE